MIADKLNNIMLSLVAISLLLPPNISSLSIIIYVAYVIFTSSTKVLITNFRNNIWLLCFLSSFYIINLLSYFYSENKDLALFDFEIKLSLIVFPIIFLSIKKIDENTLSKVLFNFALSSLLFAITLIFYTFIKEGKLLFNQELSMQFYIHASYLSLYLSFGFFVILNMCIKNQFKSWHIFLLIIYIITLGILASRSVFASTVVITIIWLLISHDIPKTIKIIFFIFIILSIASLSFLEPIRTRFKESINFSTKVELDTNPDEYKTLNRDFGGRAIRVAIWQCSKDITNKHWILGVGAGDSQDELQKAYKNHAFEFAWRYNSFNAHNLFLQSLIACGIMGLLSIVAIIIYLLLFSIKTKNKVFISFVVLFILLSFVESTFNVHKGVVFFSFFSGLFLNHFLKKRDINGIYCI